MEPRLLADVHTGRKAQRRRFAADEDLNCGPTLRTLHTPDPASAVRRRRGSQFPDHRGAAGTDHPASAVRRRRGSQCHRVDDHQDGKVPASAVRRRRGSQYDLRGVVTRPGQHTSVGGSPPTRISTGLGAGSARTRAAQRRRFAADEDLNQSSESTHAVARGSQRRRFAADEDLNFVTAVLSAL